MRTFFTAAITAIVFASLGSLGFFWWPAWVIAAALYTGVGIAYWRLTRLPRKKGIR